MFGTHPAVWDMCSRGVETAFKERKLYIWVILAVQMHFASQDILADRCAHPSFELESHRQTITTQHKKVVENWRNPLLPQHIHDDCFYEFSVAIKDVQKWSMQDGFDKQWPALASNKQVDSHPVLKMLKANKNYYMSHHPMLCGMMKYELYLKKQAAGMKLEYQSMSIFMLVHFYINGCLKCEGRRVWPDMEFVIYAQDPEWLFVGGLPKTVQEAQKKFLLVAGGKATNSARDIPLNKLKIDQKNFQEFRNTMVFGSGVNIDKDKFAESMVYVTAFKLEDLVKRLRHHQRSTTLVPARKATCHCAISANDYLNISSSNASHSTSMLRAMTPGGYDRFIL
jgi:hypothetical protein